MAENHPSVRYSPVDNLLDGVRNKGTITDPDEDRLLELEVMARNWAAQALIEDVENVGGPNDAIVRDMHPHLDLESGDDSGWNGDDQEFVQSGLTADQLNETYVVDEDGRAEGKAIAIYALSNTAVDPLTTTIRFRNVTGGIFEHMQLEDMLVGEDTTAAMVQPMLFRPGETVTIEQWAEAAGDDELILHAVTAEAAERTLKGQYE